MAIQVSRVKAMQAVSCLREHLTDKDKQAISEQIKGHGPSWHCRPEFRLRGIVVRNILRANGCGEDFLDYPDLEKNGLYAKLVEIAVGVKPH